MSKIIYNILAGLMIVYMGIVATLFITQRDKQYNPDKTDHAPSETKVPEMIETQVMVPGEDTRESWYYLPADADRIIVFFHGNGENIAARDFKARALIDAGYGVALVGYRGYGGNRGFPSEEGFYDDARTVINDLIKERGKPEASLIFYGESLGSGVAVKMATEYPKIAGLVLEVPFDSALAVAEERYWFVVGLPFLMHDQYLNDSRIGKLTMPKLFLIAGDDEVVPPHHARRLFDLAAQPKQVVEFPGAHHGNLYDHGAAARIIPFISNLSVPVRE